MIKVVQAYDRAPFADVQSDDADALAFARRIIRELMQRHSGEYADSSMHITEGERPVGSIPFDFEADKNQEKEQSRLS